MSVDSHQLTADIGPVVVAQASALSGTRFPSSSHPVCCLYGSRRPFEGREMSRPLVSIGEKCAGCRVCVAQCSSGGVFVKPAWGRAGKHVSR